MSDWFVSFDTKCSDYLGFSFVSTNCYRLRITLNTYGCHYCPQSKLQLGLLIAEAKVSNNQLKKVFLKKSNYDCLLLRKIIWCLGVKDILLSLSAILGKVLRTEEMQCWEQAVLV